MREIEELRRRWPDVAGGADALEAMAAAKVALAGVASTAAATQPPATSNLKAQHIPGYSGFMPGIQAENLYGKSFANTSANAIHGDHEKGNEQSISARYATNEGLEYTKDNFRLLKKDLEPAEVKDIIDAYNFHDAE